MRTIKARTQIAKAMLHYDSLRICALVAAIEQLEKGERFTLGSLAEQIFGWSTERVFEAIHAAIAAGAIAPNVSDKRGARHGR
jgi:hypothetical protein